MKIDNVQLRTDYNNHHVIYDLEQLAWKLNEVIDQLNTIGNAANAPVADDTFVKDVNDLKTCLMDILLEEKQTTGSDAVKAEFATPYDAVKHLDAKVKAHIAYKLFNDAYDEYMATALQDARNKFNSDAPVSTKIGNTTIKVF